MSQASTRPIVFLAFANDRDDRERYLRNLADEARLVCAGWLTQSGSTKTTYLFEVL